MDTGIIALIISISGILIIFIFSNRNWYRSNSHDLWSEKERTTRLEDQLDSLTNEIRRSNKELASDIQEVKGLVTDVGDSLKKTQIRHERLKGRVDDVSRRVTSLEKWKESMKRR